MPEERCFGKSPLEFLEDFAAIIVEVEGDVGFDKPGEWLREDTVVSNKPSVEIAETKK